MSSMQRRKLLLAAVLFGLVVAYFALGLERFLNVDAIRERQAEWAALYEARPVLAAAVFFAVYVAATALSIPVATVLTLAAGAIFGLVAGTVIVSFASSLGATLAFLVSRYLLRGSVEARLGARLAEIDKGIAREGAFYLFTLRLVPLVPFFVVNLALGLTTMKTATFYAVSQIGMLAATLVYVNAGTQLARIESVSGIVSPDLLVAFALLGVFPLAARWLVGVLQRRKVYARWAGVRPRRFDRNLIVIGAGAAGLVTSYIAAAVKAKVTLVEAGAMGGDCLNTGCVPSKALIRSAKLVHRIRHASEFGIAQAEAKVEFGQIMERIARVIAEIAPHDSVARYEALGVDVVAGHARLVDPWTVQIACNDGSTKQLTARSIVLATGSAPVVPPLPGLDEVGYLTSDTLWGLRELPRRLVVLGGGPIGCELAQAFARLGSVVTLIEALPRLLSREDVDVSALAQSALERDGVRVLAAHNALRCGRDGTAKFIVLGQAGAMPETRVEFDALLCAVGRAARLGGYGLEELGIPASRTIETNEYLETLIPNIYAAGDAAGPYQFTHAAAHQAWTAAVNGLFGSVWRFKVDNSVIPWATFIDPEVARVGLNEQEASAKGIAVEVTRYDLAELDRAIVDGVARGFVKVLTAPGSDRILGATIVGEHAAELLAEFVLAMKHGLGLQKILATIHVYPTLSEANKYAAGAWKRQHAPQRLLAWAARFHGWRRG
jgi:pyruvate/2-oxoglutarate dehydrogenase complex dihydrolipoamide dehydrogenase (E3) component/uncharacterized membrane protein YdjX (TVP38/TMEM64 family)